MILPKSLLGTVFTAPALPILLPTVGTHFHKSVVIKMPSYVGPRPGGPRLSAVALCSQCRRDFDNVSSIYRHWRDHHANLTGGRSSDHSWYVRLPLQGGSLSTAQVAPVPVAVAQAAIPGGVGGAGGLAGVWSQGVVVRSDPPALGSEADADADADFEFDETMADTETLPSFPSSLPPLPPLPPSGPAASPALDPALIDPVLLNWPAPVDNVASHSFVFRTSSAPLALLGSTKVE